MVDVRMPNGMIIRNVPEGTPREVLLQKMQKYETIKSIPSNDLEILRNNLDNPDVVGKIQEKYGVSVDSIKKTFPKQFSSTGKNISVSSPDNKEKVSDLEKGIGFVAKNLAQGFAGLGDLPAMGFKELLSRQTGVPIEAIDSISQALLGGSLPSEMVGTMIDPNKKYEPETMAGRYAKTGLQMLGGGAKPDLSTLGATLGLQTAAEMDAGVGGQILGALAGGMAGGKAQSALTQPNKNLAKEVLTKGEKALTKELSKAGEVSDLLSEPSVAKRAETALGRTPDAYQAGVDEIKNIEENLFKSVKPIKKGLKAKVGAETISDVMDLERSNATKPLYEKAFLENGKYVRPKGVDSAKLQLALEEANPTYNSYKVKSLNDTRNIKKLESGFENSLAMIHDIKSRINKDIYSFPKGKEKDNLIELTRQLNNLIDIGTPDNKLKVLKLANKKYTELSQKIDNVFGKFGGGKLGALLKFDDYDAQAQEKILPQLKKVFEAKTENVQKYKNIFDKYGQNHKWASAFSAYNKDLVDNLKETETLYSKINETREAKRRYMSALPKKYSNKFDEVIKLGSTLEELKNKAVLGKMYKQGLTKEDIVDLTRTFGKGQRGSGFLDFTSNFFNRFRDVHSIDKEIVSILFDPVKSEQFLNKYNRLKSLPEKKNFVIQYITDNAASKARGISTAITNKQSEE